jgi:FlaA1/EpsC-like NDP-sugar epimerase
MSHKNKNLEKEVKTFFNSITFGFDFKNFGYLPRWLVLALDVLVVLISGVLTFVLLQGVRFIYIDLNYLGLGVAIYLMANIFFFWMFKTYSGIIRHSSFLDALKLFVAQVCTSIFMLLVNYISLYDHNNKLYLTTGILIHGLMSFALLFLYRVLVKQTFDHYFKTNQKDDLTGVLIFGTDTNAIAVAKAIASETPGRFKVIGFVDKVGQNTSKQLLGLPIFPYLRKVSIYLRAYKADALIVADKQLTKIELSNLINECIDYRFKVYSVPLVSDIEDEQKIRKQIKSFNILDLLGRKPIVLDTQKISSKLNGQVIWVTGAAGSIGSEIVKQVIQYQPAKVILLDQAETPLHELTLALEKMSSACELIPVMADIRDKDRLRHAFIVYPPDVIYHAAAYKHVPLMESNPSQAILTNVMGTKNMADLAYEFGVNRFVMISTDKAVNPSNVMGASKRIAEIYCQSLHYKYKEEPKATKYITTRFGNVLGSNGSVVPLFAKQIESGGPVTLTHPDIIRYFMTIPEACQLVLEAGAMGQGGEIFIFDMGNPIRIMDLAKKMIRLAGLIPEKDIPITITGLRPGEKLYEELLTDASKTLPTHHEKIMIATDVTDDFEQIKFSVKQLIQTAKNTDNLAIVAAMKQLVPEYKSLNSEYSDLDAS